MAPLSAHTTELLNAVLAQFGVRDAALGDIRRGRVNKHWRVEAGDRSYVLRRYHERPSAGAIAYEHDVLRHLEAKRWPVAVPLPAESGNTVVELEDRRYALFPLLPGRPAPYSNQRYARLKGRLLARLHQDLASWEAPGQREGFGRVWELDTEVAALAPFPSFNALLMVFGEEHTDLARAVRWQKYAMLRELSALGYGELPATPGHFDYHHDNLLFQRGELTGLLDFDSVHLDARTADIASAIALDCIAPPAYNELDPGAVRAFVGGYTEHTALTDTELQLIVPLVRAHMVIAVAQRIAQWSKGEQEKRLQSIRRTVDRRFPSFSRLRGELEAAVLQAPSER